MNFKCHICDKTYKTKQSMKRHIDKKHKNHRPHVCNIAGCKKTFYYQCDLERHSQTHLKSKFICPKCEKSYDRVSQLNKHSLFC